MSKIKLRLNNVLLSKLLIGCSVSVADLVSKSKNGAKPISCVSRTTFDNAFKNEVDASKAKEICDQLTRHFREKHGLEAYTYRDWIDPEYLVANPQIQTHLLYLDDVAGLPATRPATAHGTPTESGSISNFRPDAATGTTRPRFARLSTAVLISVVICGLAAFLLLRDHNDQTESQVQPADDVQLSMRVLPRGADISIPVEQATLPVRPGDSVQFIVSSSRPKFCYLFWLDALGKLTPVWPWKDMTWADPIPRVSAVKNFSFPDGATHLELFQDHTGIHSVILIASSERLANLDRIRERLEKMPYMQSGLNTIYSATLVHLQDGRFAGSVDRNPLMAKRTLDAKNPISVLQAELQACAQQENVSTAAICFAFGEPLP